MKDINSLEHTKYRCQYHVATYFFGYAATPPFGRCKIKGARFGRGAGETLFQRFPR